MHKEFRADLHCHSTCSDGSFSPLELIALAQEIGLSALSITDHDSIYAYTKETFQKATSASIVLVPGIEISTMLNGSSVHMLAYRFPIDSPEIHALCLRHKERRQNRNTEILDLLKKAGMPISLSDLPQSSSNDPRELARTIGRPHIAEAMIKKGYVTSIEEAFIKYLGDGRPCYSPGKTISTEETLEIVHRTGALAVIAHPHLIQNQNVISALLTLPFDGIECYYAKLSRAHHARWLKIAAKKNWLITGGSDFHGATKPSSSLGSSWIDESLFNKVMQKSVG